jgi:hypothetical protein
MAEESNPRLQHPAAQALAVGGTSFYEDARGSIRVARLAPHVVRFTNTGHLSVELAQFGLAQTALLLAEQRGSYCGFYDWQAMTGYASEARSVSTSFVMKNRKHMRRVAILTGSNLVAMGVNVANVVVSGFIGATTRRDEFEAWVRDAVATPKVP